MYKGAQVILFSFEPKGTYVYVKVRRIFMNEIPSPRELISGGS